MKNYIIVGYNEEVESTTETVHHDDGANEENDEIEETDEGDIEI